jgi:hypothetical protein
MSRPAKAGQELTPQLWFHRVATHYVVAQVVHHLNELGVLAELAKREAATAEELATAVGLRPEPLRTVLEFLAGVDPLVRHDEDDRFVLSTFGHDVLRRFARTSEDGRREYNLFDLRVGAYGPIWTNLDRVLRGDDAGVVRHGRHAAQAAYKLAPHFEPLLREMVRSAGARSLVELGCSTGLLELIGETEEGLVLYGVDVAEDALRIARARSSARGIAGARFLRADVFEPETWTSGIEPERPGLLFTIHVHEFLARGVDDWMTLMRALNERLPGWRMVVFEQPRLTKAEADEAPEDLRLFNEANILIHHIANKGRILTTEALKSLFERAGCTVESTRDVGYLGFLAFTVHFGAR